MGRFLYRSETQQAEELHNFAELNKFAQWADVGGMAVLGALKLSGHFSHLDTGTFIAGEIGMAGLIGFHESLKRISHHVANLRYAETPIELNSPQVKQV